MKKKLTILMIIIGTILGIGNNIYAQENTDDVAIENIETTCEPEQITEETIYYTVTFIDEVRNTRVVKTVKDGDIVEPEQVSDEIIYIDKKWFEYFEYWATRKGEDYIEFNFKKPIVQDTILYAFYSKTFERGENNIADITITFDTQGGNNIEEQSIAVFDLIKEPEPPVKVGYKFLGWYTEAKGGEKWNFKKKARGYMTLYAHWEYVGTGSNISPQTGYNANWAFAILIMSLGTAVFSSAKLSYKK